MQQVDKVCICSCTASGRLECCLALLLSQNVCTHAGACPAGIDETASAESAPEDVRSLQREAGELRFLATLPPHDDSGSNECGGSSGVQKPNCADQHPPNLVTSPSALAAAAPCGQLDPYADPAYWESDDNLAAKAASRQQPQLAQRPEAQVQPRTCSMSN